MNTMIGLDKIQTRIIEIRGVRVILDKDLADMYQVETSYLNKAVKRNVQRFPKQYMFQLTREEFNSLMFQFGTSRWGGTRKLPFAFTEHGVLMTASVLNSDIAIAVNQKIIEAFVELRREISTNPEYAVLVEKINLLESRMDTLDLTQRLESKVSTDKVVSLSKKVRELSNILDDFQSTHLIIKRPEDIEGEG